MLTYTDRKDSRAESVSDTSQAHSRAVTERPDAAGNQELCPALPIMGSVCGLWEEQGGITSVYVLGRWGDGEVACQGCIPRLVR